jgi:hypothetical protein
MATGEQNRARKIITIALLFMLLGTAAELYLLEHFDDTLQLIPLIGIGSALLVLFGLLYQRTPVLVTVFKILLVLTGLSGFYGTFLHLRANYEFELEMRPTAEGWDLFRESMSGALPALAPFSMVVLALIGYSYLLLIKQERR